MPRNGSPDATHTDKSREKNVLPMLGVPHKILTAADGRKSLITHFIGGMSRLSNSSIFIRASISTCIWGNQGKHDFLATQVLSNKQRESPYILGTDLGVLRNTAHQS